MIKIRAVSYEEGRLAYFKEQRAAAQRRMEYWCRPGQPDRYGWMETEDRATENGMICSYLDDVIRLLEAENDEST